MTSTKQTEILVCRKDSYAHAVINRLSQPFQTLSPVSCDPLVYIERHESGRWLLERPEFIYWLHNDNCSTFWLSGSQGAGKSTLASYVLEDLKRGHFGRVKSSAIVHYFHDARYRVSSSAAMVLREIIRELLPRQNQNSSRQRLLSILAVLEAGDNKLSIPQLRSYFTAIQPTMAVVDTLFLVLDGLDEVEEPESSLVEELLYLAQHQDVTHRIKCFFSGSSSWSRSDIFKGGARINIDEVVRSRRDLAYFIKSEVEKLLNSSYYVQAFYERLSANPEGIFSRAVLALRSLRQFDTSNETRILSFIDSIPQSLTRAYQEVLSSIAEVDRKKTRKLLALVTYTFRPLQLPELLDAMDFDLRKVYPVNLENMAQCDLGGHSHTENDILRLSGGLLTFGKDKTVQFIHKSVRDFIKSQSTKSVLSCLCMSEYQAHEILSRICLHFLRPCYSKRIMDPSEEPKEMDGFGSREYEYFMEYAIQYWSHHYKVAEVRSNNLPGLLQHLIQENLEYFWRKDCEGTNAFAGPPTQHSSSAALCIGTKVGSVKLVKMLLEMGADPDTYIDCAGNNALHIAAAYGHLAVVNILLKFGARVNLPSGITGRTPLYYASAAGHTAVMSLLLNAKRLSTDKTVSLDFRECIPLCTAWVLCDPDDYRFGFEEIHNAKHGSFLLGCDQEHAVEVESSAAQKESQAWEISLRRLMIGEGIIKDATLNPSQQRDLIRLTSAQRDSKNKGVDPEHSILDFLVQQLLENGIDGVWRYSEAFGLQRSEVNYATADRIRVAMRWNLVADAKYGKGMARNWGRALEIAVQRGQEGSIRLLLENEAVVLEDLVIL
jgi:hypothetical protein